MVVFAVLGVVVPMIFSVVLIAPAVRRRRFDRRLARDGRHVVALVLSNEEIPDDEDESRFIPQVWFRTNDGREIKTALDGALSYRSYKIESTMDVVYDPLDPRRAFLAGNEKLGDFTGPVITGVIFLGIAFGDLYFALAPHH